MAISTVVRGALGVVLGLTVTYVSFLAILTVPYFQDHIIYLHKIELTWGKDVNQPERWGFLYNQITPFSLQTLDGETLRAWHVLPIGLYHRHETALCQEPSGLVPDITSRLSFKLLRDDPEALLVIYLHGAAGTLASGHRPQSYRAISAGCPSKIHIVAIDYRGFGESTGWPSESGLLTDALTLTKWATTVVGIPSSRIVVFGQSIGTAVVLSLTSYLAAQTPPTFFSGIVLVAPFTDVERLTATCRLAGTIPLLSPIARYPSLLAYLNKFIVDKWDSKARIASLIHSYEASNVNDAGYHITIIHAIDDYDIHYSHSEELFLAAVNATKDDALNNNNHQDLVEETKSTNLGAGGNVTEWQGPRGVIRKQILVYGLHDWIMGYPTVSLAILKAFENRTPGTLMQDTTSPE